MKTTTRLNTKKVQQEENYAFTLRGNRPTYIAVEGAIGVGKTTLVKQLAEHFAGKILLEVVEDNPFLPDFYRDKKKHAFQTQLFFLLPLSPTPLN